MLKRKLDHGGGLFDSSPGGGLLDSSFGSAAGATWTLRVDFDGDDSREVHLHREACRSAFLTLLQDTDRFGGSRTVTLDPAWRSFFEPLMRILYIPEAVDFFVEQLLVSHARTIGQALAVSHCAIYLDLDAPFFAAFYAAVRSRRRRWSAFIDDDRFELPRAWRQLPLGHALRWLHALCPSAHAARSNLAAYLAAEPGLSESMMHDGARDEEARRRLPPQSSTSPTLSLARTSRTHTHTCGEPTRDHTLSPAEPLWVWTARHTVWLAALKVPGAHSPITRLAVNRWPAVLRSLTTRRRRGAGR